MADFINQSRRCAQNYIRDRRMIFTEKNKKITTKKKISTVFSSDTFKDYFSAYFGEDKIRNINRIMQKEKCSVFFYDTMGNFTSCLYGESNHLYGKGTNVDNARTEYVGINAVGGAIDTGQACIICGNEHTLTVLQGITGYACPISNKHSSLEGILYIVSEFDEMSDNLANLLESLRDIFNESPLIYSIITIAQTYLQILNAIDARVSEGIVFMDETNRVHGFNEKVIQMLNLADDVVNPNAEIYKWLINIEGFQEKEFKNYPLVYESRKGKRSILFSSEHLTLMDKDIGKLLTFVDPESVSKLNNSLKGNQTCYTFKDIIGESLKLKELKEMAKKVAQSESHILIHGESGTGKELLSQSIHNESSRKTMPFIAINCGAMPLELMESELFGYEPGTFTGASKTGKIGKIEFSSGGTLFLDEIESMPLSLQIKLLRVLSSNTVTRLGGVIETPVDLRIIAATKKDLYKEAQLGNFREDLYYRIQVIDLSIPSLRERKEDIVILVNHMIDDIFHQLYSGNVEIEQEYIEALISYDWPGNVRELRNTIERSLVIARDEPLSLKHLRPQIVDKYLSKDLFKVEDEIDKAEEGLLERLESMLIKRIMKEEDDNMTAAAKRLGISRQTLYRKLKW